MNVVLVNDDGGAKVATHPEEVKHDLAHGWHLYEADDKPANAMRETLRPVYDDEDPAPRRRGRPRKVDA